MNAHAHKSVAKQMIMGSNDDFKKICVFLNKYLFFENYNNLHKTNHLLEGRHFLMKETQKGYP